MKNYKEQTISGTSWTRAFHVDCHNPIDGAKTITYHEEAAILIDGKTVTSRNGQTLQCDYSQTEGATFYLVHPETGVVLGQMTEQDLYLALSSHYLHKAQARDAAALGARIVELAA